MTSTNDQLFSDMEIAARAIHPDADRLLDGLRHNDSESKKDPTTDRFLPGDVADTVNGESIFAVAMLRALEAMRDFSPREILLDPADYLAAIWVDGAIAGIQFQLNGGHQEQGAAE